MTDGADRPEALRRSACSRGTGSPRRLDADAADHAVCLRLRRRLRSATSRSLAPAVDRERERLAGARLDELAPSPVKIGHRRDPPRPRLRSPICSARLLAGPPGTTCRLGRDGRVPEIEAEAAHQRAGLGERAALGVDHELQLTRAAAPSAPCTSSSIGVAVHQPSRSRAPRLARR